MNKDKKIYWAPNVRWSIQDRELQIESIKFHGDYEVLFPEFYFVCSEGTTMEGLLKYFHEYNSIKLKKFISKLSSMRILITNIQSTFEIFSAQERLYQPDDKIDHDYFMNAENVATYRKKCLKRCVVEESEKVYQLNSREFTKDIFHTRRSIRNFTTNKLVTRGQLESLLDSISQFQAEGKFSHYCYPSAGGLYPIDCYLKIKADRVEEIDEGLYYYDPLKRKLLYVSDGTSINRECHYFINKDIYKNSAFSFYLFYNANVSMPKYGSKAYYYGILDAGIMIGYLNMAAASCGLGCCSIGDLKFSNIEKEFKLNEFQTYLHCIEFGNIMM